MRRNPDSHWRTEWLHARILEAKIALAADPRALEGRSIAGVVFDPVTVPPLPTAYPPGNDGKPVKPHELAPGAVLPAQRAPAVREAERSRWSPTCSMTGRPSTWRADRSRTPPRCTPSHGAMVRGRPALSLAREQEATRVMAKRGKRASRDIGYCTVCSPLDPQGTAPAAAGSAQTGRSAPASTPATAGSRTGNSPGFTPPRAHTQASTRVTPARSSVSAAACRVAPVVITSSTRVTWAGSACPGRIAKARRRLRRRAGASSRDWGAVSRTRSSARSSSGRSSALASGRASSRAWSKPRSRSRRGAGAGERGHRAGARRPGPRPCAGRRRGRRRGRGGTSGAAAGGPAGARSGTRPGSRSGAAAGAGSGRRPGQARPLEAGAGAGRSAGRRSGSTAVRARRPGRGRRCRRVRRRPGIRRARGGRMQRAGGPRGAVRQG